VNSQFLCVLGKYLTDEVHYQRNYRTVTVITVISGNTSLLLRILLTSHVFPDGIIDAAHSCPDERQREEGDGQTVVRRHQCNI